MQQGQQFSLCPRDLCFVYSKAVLVAIAIPVFTSQLEKSRDSVSVSNLRAAYALSQTALLTADGTTTTDGDCTIEYNTNKSVKSITVAKVVSKGTNGDLSGLDAELPFTIKSSDLNTLGGTPTDKNGRSIKFSYTYDTNGAISAIEASIG